MIVDVAVPFRVPQTFHYQIDPQVGESLKPGSVLEVPFGSRKTFAYVMGFPDETEIESHKLKTISQVLVSEPLFDPSMLKLIKWVSEYYCHPIGEVLSVALPKQAWNFKITERNKKVLQEIDSEKGSLSNFTLGQTPKPQLTEEQFKAVTQILDPEQSKPILLHGVTGSGKTEIYMSVLEEVLSDGKGAIILCPEISLTPQLLDRFSFRFPGQIAVLHSELTARERYIQWQRVYRGKARVVIGPRSAVFAPIKDLGLIVVDEEHESSFKQEDSLRYHARDVAVVRAHQQNSKVVLGSATPCIESFANAVNGKYDRIRLRHRVKKQPLPTAHFVNLRDSEQLYSNEMPWLSKTLVKKLSEVQQKGQQALLFLNRLGYAHFLYCQDCGHTWNCRDCDVTLTFYQKTARLKCHYCGHERRAPNSCEKCNGTKLETMGVGTEQVEQGLRRVFPQARIARMDRSAIKKRKDLEALLTQISKKEVDFVIGTQMITKGHDFPEITLVGILLADASLNLPDFRASERTFQMIAQVSGRAGRAELPGEVVIQAIDSTQPVLHAAAENRLDEFYHQELQGRERFCFPPYSRMAVLRFQHRQKNQVRMVATQTAAFISSQLRPGQVEVLGPSEAPMSRVKGLYRWQCVLKAKSIKDLKWILKRASDFIEAQKQNIQFAIDVDPLNLW